LQLVNLKELKRVCQLKIRLLGTQAAKGGTACGVPNEYFSSLE